MRGKNNLSPSYAYTGVKQYSRLSSYAMGGTKRTPEACVHNRTDITKQSWSDFMLFPATRLPPEHDIRGTPYDTTDCFTYVNPGEPYTSPPSSQASHIT